MALPQKYRVPIHLYYYEDYSVREVAQILGLRKARRADPPAAARQKLKQTLEGFRDEGTL